MSMLCVFQYIILLVVLYKILDWLIRRFYIGKYNERYILVTGCDTGFGNLAAKRLDKLGCHVFAGCYTEAGGKELTSLCSNKLQVISLDISNPESVRKASDTVKSKLPEGKGLWGILNNAGILGACGPPEWLIVDDYKACCSVNLYGTIDVTVTFLPLVKLARGRVVNTASIAGRIGYPAFIPYCVSKFGVEAFTDGLRRSMRPFEVKVMLIEPGGFNTHMDSVKNTAINVDKSWNRASQETKEEYGDIYYKYFVKDRLEEWINQPSTRVDRVVDAYQHALLGVYPRARYVVGFDAKFVWLPLQWMPEWLGDWMFTKLFPNEPLPAAVINNKVKDE